jgi:hypothetical protein
MLKAICRAACVAALGWVLAPCVAQTPPATLPVSVLPTGSPPPKIDGRLDEPVWASAPAFSAFRRYRPDTQLDPGDYRSEVRVLVEPGALVFAFRAWDPRADEIRAPLSRRDQVWPDQDSVTVWIDPAGRGQVAQFVRVNASGSVADGLYTAADDAEDAAPDFLDVEVAAQQLPDGYSVEIRWPLANLRYPLDGEMPWGLMLTRRVPRSTPLSFSSAPLHREMPHLLFDLQRLQDEAPLRAQLQGARHLSLRTEGTWRHDGERGRANLGVELQWRPRADWVIDATLRPDFSQVELDEPQLAGNTRFALFVPEKRAFFLESSDVVGQVPPDDWDVSRGLLAFYSRAVTAPRWGVRATQRGSQMEGTVLMLRDAGGGLVMRPDAFGTALQPVDQASTLLFARQRLRLSETLAAAGLVSLRDWGGGASTRVAGVDALWAPDTSTQLRGHLLASEDRSLLDEDTGLHAGPARRGHAGWLSWRWREGDWRLSLDSERISPRFVNDNGFVPQAGIARDTFDLLRAFETEDGDFLSAWELLLRASRTRALRDAERGLLQSQAVSEALHPGFWLLAPLATEVFGYWNLERVRTRADGQLHRPRSVLIGIDTHPGARFAYLNLEGTFGERVDQDADRVGRGFDASAQLTWREPLAGGRNLEIEQRLGAGRVAAPGGGAALDERSSQTKLILHLGREQAIRLLWQVQRLQRVAEVGIAAERGRTRTGTLTWLVREGALRGWSVGASWSRDDGDAAKRELFVKYQHGWATH